MRFPRIFPLLLMAALPFSCEPDSSGDTSVTGKAGSMTRFAINSPYLYVVEKSRVKVFIIGDGQFTQAGDVPTAEGMETIFINGDHLYLGANDGMYIYSLADPVQPAFVFRYEHIVACDPVVVQGDRAFVTIRSTSDCAWTQSEINALEIIDISDPYKPELIRSYPMKSPYGLAIDDDLLFVCEGEHGLKIFNVTPHAVVLAGEHKDFFAYDVILRDGVASITGNDGILQFAYGEEANSITFLSRIAVEREP